MNIPLILAVSFGVATLLFLILKVKLPAFISLLIVCIEVGLLAGLSIDEAFNSISKGVGDTLGFVAVIIGLGALFGGFLESSGGVQVVAEKLLAIFKIKRAPWALMLTGFLVAIPVFFDVAFIILIPLVYALARKTKKSLFLYAIPLLAGLVITHSFIPPTPGPVAVAEILNANLGWVILLGALVGLPTAIISGPIFGRFLAKRRFVEVPERFETTPSKLENVNLSMVFYILILPIVLIVLRTLFSKSNSMFGDTLNLLGHPFSALILANLLAWYFLGIRNGVSKEKLLSYSVKSFEPAGVIILLTGVGGAFKQILVTTKVGELLAGLIDATSIHPLFFAFFVAALIRVLQGSATTAMIAAAGIVFPLVSQGSFSEAELALFVLAIASGASILSHVNDSGFWLVGQYLGLNEKETFQSWTILTTLIALLGIFFTFMLWFLV